MMKRNQWAALFAVASLVTAGLGVRQFAHAQDATAPTPPPGGGFGGGGGRGGGFGGFGGGAASMAVSGNNLYILRGGTVYRLDATNLTVAAHADLPAPAMPAGGGGGFRFRNNGGGGPGGGAPGGDQGAPPPPAQN